MPSPLLALGAALAGQLALNQGLWLAGGVLLAAGAALMASAVLHDVHGRQRQGDQSATLAPAADTASVSYRSPAPDSCTPAGAIDTGPATVASAQGHSLLGGWTGALTLLIVLVLAAIFRAPIPTYALPGLSADEARLGLDAAAVLAGALTPAAWDGWPIFHLFTVLSVKLLGQTALAVRLPALIGGIVSVAAITLLGRQIGGGVVGSVAGLLTAVLLWHVDTTRAAWGYVAWGVAVQALGVALAIRAARRQNGFTAGVAGLLLGLGLQASWTGLAAVAAAALLGWRLSTQTTGRRVPHRALVAPFLVYLVVAAGPVFVGVSAPDRHLTLGRTSEAATLGADRPDYARRLLTVAGMFNVAGDPNPLHNLDRAPHLDVLSAALMALGIGLAAARWGTASGGPLLVWLGLAGALAALVARAPGPDSLAAFSLVTPVIVLVALAITSLSGYVAGQPVRVTHWRLDVLVLLLVVIVAINAHALFVRRPADAIAWASYGTAQEMAAEQIRRLSPEVVVYLADVWLDDPTIMFLAPRPDQPRRIDAAQSLPFRIDHSFAYFAPGRQEVVTEDLERIYEDGEIDRYRSPLNDSEVVLRTFRAPAKVVAGARGVTLRATSADRGRTNRYTLSTFELRWPVAGESAQSALDLYTSLAVDTPGLYRFRLDGPESAQLEVNGVTVGRAGSDLTAPLAAGIQRVRVLSPGQQDSRITLRWQPPDAADLTAIPADRLYREQRAASGLLAAYRTPDSAGDTADLFRVERYVQREANPAPVGRPHTLDLIGILDLPKPGTYRFRLTGSGPVGMWLDDQPVPLRGAADEAASMVLSEGDHRIRIRLQDSRGPTHLNLTWAPPNEGWGAIPTSRFTPPLGHIDAALAAAPAAPGTAALGRPEVAWLESLEGEPRSVAVSASGAVYVTNVTTRETQRVVGSGQAAQAVDGLAVSVPADLEVGADGAVWVLDALDGQLWRRDPQSGEVRPIGDRSLGFYRPRGFGLGADGTVVVADTGGSRLARLTTDGQLIAFVGPEVGGPARLRQPTDVAVAENGDLYVVNGEGGDVLHLTPDGRYLHHWTVLPADTERGAHIAVGPDESVWVSEPDGRRISRFTPTGAPAGVVDQTREGRLLRAPVGIAVGRDGTLYVADVSLRAVLAIRFR